MLWLRSIWSGYQWLLMRVGFFFPSLIQGTCIHIILYLSNEICFQGSARKINFCQWCGGQTKHDIPDGEEKMRAICTLCEKISYQNPKMVRSFIIITKIVMYVSVVLYDWMCLLKLLRKIYSFAYHDISSKINFSILVCTTAGQVSPFNVTYMC